MFNDLYARVIDLTSHRRPLPDRHLRNFFLFFLFFNRYIFIFIEIYHFSQDLNGLFFFGIGIGLCFVSLLVPVIYFWAQRDLAHIRTTGGDCLPPEVRLWFAKLDISTIPISLSP